MGQGKLSTDTGRIIGRVYEEEGLELSGGQQQYIAVARLYFDSFEIAILDEPSAALDPIAARQMQREMFRFVGRRSMLIVSHDMSIAKNVDQVLFLEGGKLVGQGTHAKLMRENRKYAEFYECQAQNYRN